jgi:diguanylate cyclase (GGDEF)-like protein
MPDSRTDFQAAAEQLLDATIMMVDDDPTTLMVIRSFLQKDGYKNFVMIEKASRVLTAIEENRPDILLLDLMMPEVSGFDILKSVRGNQKLRHLPVLVLTASEEEEDKLRCLDLGATDILAKPVDQIELRLRVRNTLAAKAYLDQLAYYDRQTGLPNRHTFFDRLQWNLEWSRRDRNRFAVLSIELDQFATISNTLGIQDGDELLRTITGRLQKVIRKADSLGHFGASAGEKDRAFLARIEGGVFSLLLYRITGEDAAARVAGRILREIRAPIQLGGREIYLTASIGIATYPGEVRGSSELMRQAAIAKDHVQNHGGDAFQFSSGQIEKQFRRKLALEAGLRKALEKNEFHLVYQPRVNIVTGVLVSVEALIRWKRADGRMVSPVEFIPIAEETGLIHSIGKWVIDRACAQLAEWHRKHDTKIGMSVNLSPIQFLDRNLPAVISKVLSRYGIDPGYLTLELTENVMISDLDVSVEIMKSLKALGLSLAVDDFGVGFSALSYLTKFPLDELKLDKSFVDSLLDEEKSRALASSVVYLGRKLGMLTVAEGVEKREQLDFLRQQNCDLYQGALFSMPITAAKIEKHLNGG